MKNKYSLIYSSEASQYNMKPKFTVSNVINKFIISLGIKLQKKVRVYYKWDKEEPQIDDPYNFDSFIIVDFNPIIREWSITFVHDYYKTSYATIDDITGTISISNK